MEPLVIPHLLTEEECHRVVLEAEARGFQAASVRTQSGARHIPGIRNNERVDFEDPVLHQLLWRRIRPHLDGTPMGLDPHLRVYRYDVGQRFRGHRDGAVSHGALRSRLSFLVFLNDDFEGGQTRFRRKAPFDVEPDMGAALLFPHASWHAGVEVRRGRKYVLRTDVLYALTPAG